MAARTRKRKIVSFVFFAFVITLFYLCFYLRKGFRKCEFSSKSNEYDAARHPIAIKARISNRNAQLMQNLRATTEGDEIMISNGEAANGPDIQAS
jgi:hypothetical protein